MNNNNNKELNDKEIRDLLKWRLLEQVEDDDLLTQKLIDMEAKLAFDGEALYEPTVQKENELLKKLQSRTSPFFKWFLSGLALFTIVAVFYYFNKRETTKTVSALKKEILIPSKSHLPRQQNDAIMTKDSAFSESRIIHVRRPEKDSLKKDTLQKESSENWIMGDIVIKSDYKPGKQKYDPKFVDAYNNIPILTPKQIAANNKLKEKMVKQLIRKDKSSWVLVPMSTEELNGKKISINAFYIATMEVTNNQYHVFLNDLIIKDKIDDYIKAVPDTNKWMIDGKKFYEPMVNNYFWHQAYKEFPVLNVSREGAKMYCDWLTLSVNEKIKAENTKEKAEAIYINDLRIPNEIEWVTAARGGLHNVSYPWSINPKVTGVQNLIGCYMCNFSIVNYPDSLKNKSDCSKIKDAITSAGSISNEYYFTAGVNSYNPNLYGLYCVSGNAAEMAWEDETHRAITKGGSWHSDAEHVKINAKENEDVTEGSPYIGFRPVFTATKK